MGIFKKDFIVGIDIGASSIKIVQFVKKEDGLHLIKAATEEFGFNAVERSQDEQVISVLKRLLRGIDVNKSKVIVSINCPKTAVTRAVVPYIPKQELADGVRLEAKNFFPFLIEEAQLDFEITDEIMERGVKKLQLLIAASPQKTINRYLSLLEKAGIKPASFIPASYALQKLVESSSSIENKTQCLLDIGSHYTELAIFSDEGAASLGAKKNLIFSHKIPAAGNDFTNAMTGVLVSDKGRTELVLDEAETIKRRIGIPPKCESQMIDDKISTAQILSMLISPLEQLINEIERCLDYYREETGGRIDSLVLFGGGASLKGLKDFLSESLGIEVVMGNVFEGIKTDVNLLPAQSDFFYRFELAAGAVLSEGKGINLLPLEKRQELKRTFRRAFIQSAVITVIFLATFVYTGMKIQLGNLHKKIAVARMELNSLKPQLEKALKQNVIAGFLRQEHYWGDVFKEISNVVPSDVYLTELNMWDKNFIIKGVIISEESVLAAFMQALEAGLFKNVSLVSIRDLPSGAGMEFEINCGMK